MPTSRQLPTVENQEENSKSLEGVLGANYRQLTLGLILIILGPAFETLSVATILPKIVTDLGGLSFYGWSFSAYMLATLVGLILAGDEASFHHWCGCFRVRIDTSCHSSHNDCFCPE